MATISHSRPQRLPQFELLRIVAMFFVVLNHVIGDGLDIYGSFSVNTSTSSGFLAWTLLQILKLIPLVGVNLFVLITGYFTIDRQAFRVKGIWRVWSTVWLYAVSIYLICSAIGVVPFTWQDLLREATPLLSNSYWFVTSYIILMLFAPLISRVIAHATHTHYVILLTVGGIICFQPLLGQYIMDNQMIILFVYLYMIGGYIRKFHHDRTIKSSYLLLSIATILLVMFLYTLYKNRVTGSDDYKVFSMTYYGLVLPLSVAVFLYARNWRINHDVLRKAILIVAPLSFSAYIIESQSVIHVLLYDNLKTVLLSIPPILLPIACISFTTVIYGFCILIDYLRVKVCRF